MTLGRSALFAAFLYLSILVAGIVLLPAYVLSQRATLAGARLWARMVGKVFQAMIGVRVEVRGLQHRPCGPALVAAKHQGMFDVIAPFAFLEPISFVLKKELAGLPIFGWYAMRSGMISVDREAHAAALKGLVKAARTVTGEGRVLIIFPEGTRSPVGAKAEYKPGVAALYRDLNLPCHLIATNSGQTWPAHGVRRRPGLCLFEFLEPIPAGLKRDAFMRELETRLETATRRLEAEGDRYRLDSKHPRSEKPSAEKHAA